MLGNIGNSPALKRWEMGYHTRSSPPGTKGTPFVPGGTISFQIQFSQRYVGLSSSRLVSITDEMHSSLRSIPFRIIDETTDYIAVDKPAFLLIHPTKPDERTTLWKQLRE